MATNETTLNEQARSAFAGLMIGGAISSVLWSVICACVYILV